MTFMPILPTTGAAEVEVYRADGFYQAPNEIDILSFPVNNRLLGFRLFLWHGKPKDLPFVNSVTDVGNWSGGEFIVYCPSWAHLADHWVVPMEFHITNWNAGYVSWTHSLQAGYGIVLLGRVNQGHPGNFQPLSRAGPSEAGLRGWVPTSDGSTTFCTIRVRSRSTSSPLAYGRTSAILVAYRRKS